MKIKKHRNFLNILAISDCAGLFYISKKLSAKFYHKHRVGEQQSAQTVVPEE